MGGAAIVAKIAELDTTFGDEDGDVGRSSCRVKEEDRIGALRLRELDLSGCNMGEEVRYR